MRSACLQNLVEYISRKKIYDSLYWKQECFGLSAERLVDKAVELKEVSRQRSQPASTLHGHGLAVLFPFTPCCAICASN